jgi:hypothetical protein
MPSLASFDDRRVLGRDCASRRLLSEPARDRAGLGGGVPMFARALSEFMLWLQPFTDARYLSRVVQMRLPRLWGSRSQLLCLVAWSDFL